MSERERENRLLQVVITHPCITPDFYNLNDHMGDFFISTMQMPQRDARTPLSFSRRKFKTFLFAARKRLRRKGENLASELFLNKTLSTIISFC